MSKKGISQSQYQLILVAHLIFNGILLAILNLNLIPSLTLDIGLKMIISALLLADLLIVPLLLKSRVQD